MAKQIVYRFKKGEQVLIKIQKEWVKAEITGRFCRNGIKIYRFDAIYTLREEYDIRKS